MLYGLCVVGGLVVMLWLVLYGFEIGVIDVVFVVVLVFFMVVLFEFWVGIGLVW